MDKATKKSVENLQGVRAGLKSAFIERDREIDGVLTAEVAGQHALLLGPPGTAKSQLARAISDATAGSDTFQYLLTKYSIPEEIFGPISFTGLKEDRFERVTTGKAPEAKVWFLDEIFKANSSILNSLLTALNERLFFNGIEVFELPLQICIGASNEYPDNGLAALYDRFTVRFWVDQIRDRDALGKLLRGEISDCTAELKNGDLERLKAAADKVKFNGTQSATLLNIRSSLADDGLLASDRTWVQAVGLIKARAIVGGREKITPKDFSILCDCLWREHKDRPRIVAVVGQSADPYGARAEAILEAATTALTELPDLSRVKSGEIGKAEATSRIAKVTSKLQSCLGKTEELLVEVDSDTAAEAKDKIERGIRSAEDLALQVIRHR